MWENLEKPIKFIDFINGMAIESHRLIYVYYKTNLIGIVRADDIMEDFKFL